MRKYFLSICISLLLYVTSSGICFGLSTYTQTLMVNGYTVQLKVPNGLRVEFVASLDGPRFPTLGPGNELLIGSRGTAIYRLKWPYNNKPETLAAPVGRNHSIAYDNGQIFVAETALFRPQFNPSARRLHPGRGFAL